MAQLIFTTGGSQQNEILKGGRTTIGRAPDNDIELDDATVSGRHAEIVQQDGSFALRDLNSSNGTTVNDQPTSERNLRGRDRVRFGSVECVFHDSKQAVTNSALISTSRSRSRKQPSKAVLLLARLFTGPSWICPVCGSDDLKTTSTGIGRVSVSGGRLCKSCGSRWTPPVPKWAAATMLAILLLLAAFVGLFDYYRWRSDIESSQSLREVTRMSNELAQDLSALQGRESSIPMPEPPATAPSNYFPSVWSLTLVALFLVAACSCVFVLLGKSGKMTIRKSSI